MHTVEGRTRSQRGPQLNNGSLVLVDLPAPQYTDRLLLKVQGRMTCSNT